MAETFLSTLLLMFISSRYFVPNARRDTEIVTVIQMTLEHVVIVQRFRGKKGRITFKEDMQMLQSEQIAVFGVPAPLWISRYIICREGK